MLRDNLLLDYAMRGTQGAEQQHEYIHFGALAAIYAIATRGQLRVSIMTVPAAEQTDCVPI